MADGILRCEGRKIGCREAGAGRSVSMSWNVLTYVRMQREHPMIPRRSFLASPDTDRWLPIFDRYKASQAVNAREGDWTMGASSRLCSCACLR